MEWNQCYSDQTIGRKRSSLGPRSHYQIDYDRLIFSSAFRRLQAKTQVFPLPGTSFVHNRLTHSLEVASVGRSLGAMVGVHLAEDIISSKDRLSQEFYMLELSNVISAACLAHDLGNPAFGHSGEAAISHYFLQNENTSIGGKPLRDYFNESEWSDLTHFEGNANALRVLTQDYPGKGKGGLGLTMSTLAAILKYPCESRAKDRRFKHRKKYGFFQSEENIFLQVAESTGMIRDEIDGYIVFKRHPFVYLVEAADDICYNIIDMEDAHRLGILSREETAAPLIGMMHELGMSSSEKSKMEDSYFSLTDDNSAISYIRSKAINVLVEACTQAFIENKDSILAGDFNHSLLSQVKEGTRCLDDIESLSRAQIYNHKSVVEIEIAGFNVMSELLNLFVPGSLLSEPDSKTKAAIKLLPGQFKTENHLLSPYQNVMLILDHVSSMTDDYATEMYRKIKGIEISRHS